MLNIEYRGGFEMSVVVSLVLGRTALLSVQLARMAGSLRFCLSRQPYTHWSFCFVQVNLASEEKLIELCRRCYRSELGSFHVVSLHVWSIILSLSIALHSLVILHC